MSDSRDLPASTHTGMAADEPTKSRDAETIGSRSGPMAGYKSSDASQAEPAPSSKKLRVRIDPAHPIGDAPRPPDRLADVAGEPSIAGGEQGATGDSTDTEFPIDAALQEGAIPEPAAGLLGDDALSEIFSVEKLQQLRLQFEQLAGHLRSQQYQLDRREAQLHSQLAQQDGEIRTSRLWFRERQQDLADREAELQRRQQEAEAALNQQFAEREAELLAREQELESQRAGLIKNLNEREAELARREIEFDTQFAGWTQDRNEWAVAQARAEAECHEAKRHWQKQADALAARHRALEQQRQSLVQPSDTTTSAEAAVQPAEQVIAANAEAEQLYRHVDAMLDLMRQFLAGQQPKAAARTAAAKDTSAEFDATESGHLGLPPEMAAMFGEFRVALGKLQDRQRNLEEAEALLTDGQTALDLSRRQLTADRHAWQEQCEIERRRISDDRRRAEADLNKKLQTLAHRGEHLERRTAAVDQLRAEVLRAQRETLELRLATDEIWAQLSGSVPPAMLTQSLARIRSKLVEQYQFERAELAEQQKQLEALAVRLDAQHDKLHQQKQALEQWVADRRNEIESQASRLVSQEMELSRRQAELEEMGQRQQSERRIYEGEIRRLLGELRREGIAATAAAA
jgi:chromosome segregation ATPase